MYLEFPDNFLVYCLVLWNPRGVVRGILERPEAKLECLGVKCLFRSFSDVGREVENLNPQLIILHSVNNLPLLLERIQTVESYKFLLIPASLTSFGLCKSSNPIK